MSKDEDKNITNEHSNGMPDANGAVGQEQYTDTETAEDSQEYQDDEESRLQAELQEQKDKYLRLYSEFENFRRRTAKEKMELTRTANEEMATAMLPVLDDFERAIKTFDGEEMEGDSTREGMLLIFNKLKSNLEKKGVKAMQIETGSEFDAEYQEAITQIPVGDDSLRGKVVDVVEKGYTLGDKVIRFAKVVIGA